METPFFPMVNTHWIKIAIMLVSVPLSFNQMPLKKLHSSSPALALFCRENFFVG